VGLKEKFDKLLTETWNELQMQPLKYNALQILRDSIDDDDDDDDDDESRKILKETEARSSIKQPEIFKYKNRLSQLIQERQETSKSSGGGVKRKFQNQSLKKGSKKKRT
jgi:hypothetical protein